MKGPETPLLYSQYHPFPPNQGRILSLLPTIAHISLTILFRESPTSVIHSYAYETDMSSENSRHSMGRAICLGIRSSSFFVDVFTDSCEPSFARYSTRRAGADSIAGYRSRFSE